MASSNGIEEATAHAKLHVMLLPSLGHGHLIPFMQLAKKLATEGLTISFVTTFHHIPTLQNKVDAARESGLDIHLVEMEVPKDHLMVGKVNSNSVQWHQLPPILAADEGLEPYFERFLGRFLDSKISPLPTPVCLIADFLLGWSSAVAKKFGIPRVNFETSGMFGMSMHQIVWDTLPRNLPRTASGRYLVPGVPWEVRLTLRQMVPELPEATTENETHQFWLRQRRGNRHSWLTIANTFRELEGEFVDHYERANGNPIRTIGPILPLEVFEDRCHGRKIAPAVQMGANTDEEKCIQWLDAQPESSVLYISFGSENSILTAQTEHLAQGLEASGVKFVWVLRTPSDAGDRSYSSTLEFLPSGFHGRMATEDRGLFLLGWAPQLSILAHPSTGGFLSHCGWNGVLEAITMGVPIIAWPLYAEQHFNSKFVVDEIRIALEAPQRLDQDLLVSRDDVKRIVRSLMVEEQGRELRKRMQLLKATARGAVAADGSSTENFKLFVSEIRNVAALVLL